MYQQLGKLLAKVGKEVIKAATSKTGKEIGKQVAAGVIIGTADKATSNFFSNDKKSFEKKLDELDKLKSKGKISPQEYEKLREQLMSEFTQRT
jgi:cell shape-determining protein MreC